MYWYTQFYHRLYYVQELKSEFRIGRCNLQHAETAVSGRNIFFVLSYSEGASYNLLIRSPFCSCSQIGIRSRLLSSVAQFMHLRKLLALLSVMSLYYWLVKQAQGKLLLFRHLPQGLARNLQFWYVEFGILYC